MYQLVLDLGNTRCKWGLFEENKLLHQGAFLNQFSDLPDELNDLTDVSKCILSGTSTLHEDLHTHFKSIPFFLSLNPALELPIKVNYESKSTLGQDRLAAAIGAQQLFPDQNCLIIDAGTCITVDLLDDRGTYQGGSIHPGINMRYQAMHTFTEKLPLYSLVHEEMSLPAKTTEGSIRAGVQKAVLNEIESFMHHYSQEYSNLKIIFTGGDANYFVENIKNNTFADSNLILKGLNHLLLFHANN